MTRCSICYVVTSIISYPLRHLLVPRLTRHMRALSSKLRKGRSAPRCVMRAARARPATGYYFRDGVEGVDCARPSRLQSRYRPRRPSSVRPRSEGAKCWILTTSDPSMPERPTVSVTAPQARIHSSALCRPSEWATRLLQLRTSGGAGVRIPGVFGDPVPIARRQQRGSGLIRHPTTARRA